MRIAVFSDIHGNQYALRAVLDAITSMGSMDEIIAAGDLCLGGSSPLECVDLLRSASVKAVYGNTEIYLSDPNIEPNDDLHRSMWSRIQPVAHWVLDQLSRDQIDWLKALPFELRFSPTENTVDDLLVVHANPKDVELMIFPSESIQEKIWGEVRQPDNDPELQIAMQDIQAGMVAFGHFHYTHHRKWRGLELVDVAPCSLPGIDRDSRARFTIFEWDSHKWVISRHLIPYNVEDEIASLKASDMPFMDDFVSYFED